MCVCVCVLTEEFVFFVITFLKSHIEKPGSYLLLFALSTLKS